MSTKNKQPYQATDPYAGIYSNVGFTQYDIIRNGDGLYQLNYLINPAGYTITYIGFSVNGGSLIPVLSGDLTDINSTPMQGRKRLSPTLQLTSYVASFPIVPQIIYEGEIGTSYQQKETVTYTKGTYEGNNSGPEISTWQLTDNGDNTFSFICQINRLFNFLTTLEFSTDNATWVPVSGATINNINDSSTFVSFVATTSGTSGTIPKIYVKCGYNMLSSTGTARDGEFSDLEITALDDISATISYEYKNDNTTITNSYYALVVGTDLFGTSWTTQAEPSEGLGSQVLTSLSPNTTYTFAISSSPSGQYYSKITFTTTPIQTPTEE